MRIHSTHIVQFAYCICIDAWCLCTCSPLRQLVPVVTEAPTQVPTEAPRSLPANPTLILATTTSTQDSGLLDVLIPLFEAQTGYTVQTVAVGSGEAMKMGEEGNADVLLVHAPSAEKHFHGRMAGARIASSSCTTTSSLLVLPRTPRSIKGLAPARCIQSHCCCGAPRLSHAADKSGTSTKELGLWKKAELDPATAKPAWYIETGQGMGASLTIASEKPAYTLTDRATYLANKDNLQARNSGGR